MLSVLADRADHCPQGHRISEWLDANGLPKRRDEQPWEMEERVCPACVAVDAAKNRAKVNRANQSSVASETVEEEPGAFWVMRRPDTPLHPGENEGAPAP